MRCHSDRETFMTHEDPRQVLEIEAEAGDEEIRAAYLRKVKQHPPDRSPREFERVRSATGSGNRGRGRRRRNSRRLSAQGEAAPAGPLAARIRAGAIRDRFWKSRQRPATKKFAPPICAR